MTRTEDLAGLVRPDIGDLPTQGANNYEYDAIGRKMKDISENITSINWTPTDKIRKVVQGETTYEHRYDAMGWRVKTTRTDTAGTHITHYVRDASGNVLGIYENDSAKEVHIYGSSRVGSYVSFTQKYTQTLGFGRFELNNHLGSVLSVIADNKHKTGTTYTARIISQTDYYAYGWQLSGHIFAESPQRHGYQGSEKSPYSNGNYTTFYRELDTRNPHWWSIDPKFKAGESPYVSMGANPVWANDVLGDTMRVKNGKPDKDMISKYKKQATDAFGGYVTVKVDKSGNVSLEKKDKRSPLPKKYQAAFDHLKAVIDSDLTVEHTLFDHRDNESRKIKMGRFRDGALDLDDISKFGDDHYYLTSLGKFVHESVEQHEKMKLIKNGQATDRTSNPEAYNNCHKIAIEAENSVNRLKRDSNPASFQGTIDGYIVKITLLFFKNSNDANYQTITYEETKIKEEK